MKYSNSLWYDFIKQPLLHFLLVGAGFFVVYQFINDRPSTDFSSNQIEVNKSALLNYYQYQNKAFNAELFEKKFASLSDADLQLLINDYVNQEVFYREGLARGLDKQDYVIKKRIAQKMRFISEGFESSVRDFSEKEFEHYYKDNLSDYYKNPKASFVHVYFDSKKRGVENANKLAQNEMVFFNQYGLSAEQAKERGDTFKYKFIYDLVSSNVIVQEFGLVFAQNLFKSTPSLSKWMGPIESEHGYHLILLTQLVEKEAPDLIEIKERVLEDARRIWNENKHRKNVEKLKEKYVVEINYSIGARTNSDNGE